MSKYSRSYLLITLAILTLLVSTGGRAEYELPESLLGYKMILASSAKLYNGQMYIGFMQFSNMTPPFVQIENKRYDMITAEIVSEVVDEKLVGKIMLPKNMTSDDIKELRINGYSILWKSTK